MAKYLKCGFVVVVYLLFGQFVNAQVIGPTRHVLQSPDNNITVNFYQKQLTDSTRAMYYTVDFKGKQVVLESDLDIQLDNHLSEEAMGLKIDHHAKWCENLKVTGFEDNE